MKKIVRLTESDIKRMVDKIIKEGDFGLPHPRKSVYKQEFEEKLALALSEAGSDSEHVYSMLSSKLDEIMDSYRYEKEEGSQHTWEDDEI